MLSNLESLVFIIACSSALWNPLKFMIGPCSIMKVYKSLAKIYDRYFKDSFISFTGKLKFYDKWFHAYHKFYASTSILQYNSTTKPWGLPSFWWRLEKSVGISGWSQALRPMCSSTFPATWAKAKSLLVDTGSVLSNWIPSRLYTHISKFGEAFWSEIYCWIKKNINHCNCL